MEWIPASPPPRPSSIPPPPPAHAAADGPFSTFLSLVCGMRATNDRSEFADVVPPAAAPLHSGALQTVDRRQWQHLPAIEGILPKPVLLSAIAFAYEQVIGRVPSLAQATVRDFMFTPTVQVLFAHLVATHMAAANITDGRRAVRARLIAHLQGRANAILASLRARFRYDVHLNAIVPAALPLATAELQGDVHRYGTSIAIQRLFATRGDPDGAYVSGAKEGGRPVRLFGAPLQSHEEAETPQFYAPVLTPAPRAPARLFPRAP